MSDTPNVPVTPADIQRLDAADLLMAQEIDKLKQVIEELTNRVIGLEDWHDIA